MVHPTENEVDEDDEDFRKHTETSSFKEPIVLVGIICLSLLNGIITILQGIGVSYTNMHDDFPYDIRVFYGLSAYAGPIPGTMGTAFMSEFTGRKPVFITLFSLSILSAVLTAISNATVWEISYVINGMVTGGSQTMTFLAIAEYCSPKHRFGYLMANAAVGFISFDIVQYLLFNGLLRYAASSIRVLTVIFGLACLGATWVWPESPYWLASKGKLVESKRVFLWLRGEQSEAEFRTLKQEQRRPGPPRLYWLPLIIAIVTLSVSLFSSSQDIIPDDLLFGSLHSLSTTWIKIGNVCSTIVIGSVLVVISYKVDRKLLFIVGCGLPLPLCYAVTAWLDTIIQGDFDFTFPVPFLWMYFINVILRRLGPTMLGMALFIETIPLKYNTHMTCVCFVFYHMIKTFVYVDRKFRILIRFWISPLAYIHLFTTLALGGVVLFHFLAQEPKDKTLLEIQKSYTPKQNVTSPEPEPIAMQHLQNEKDELVEV